jgi:hypothetical protein
LGKHFFLKRTHLNDDVNEVLDAALLFIKAQNPILDPGGIRTHVDALLKSGPEDEASDATESVDSDLGHLE